MKKTSMIIILLLLFFAVPCHAAGSASANNTAGGRLALIAHEKLAPKVAEVRDGVEKLKIAMKNTEEERQFNILRGMVFEGEMIALIGTYEIRILIMNTWLDDRERRAYYLRQSTGVESAIKEIREHDRLLRKFRDKVKNSAAVEALDQALAAAGEITGQLDVVLLIVKDELKKTGLKEQTIQ